MAILSAGIGIILWWPGATFLCLAAAYFRQEAWIFGKRHNGQMSVYAVILLLPYLLAYWATWQAQVFWDKEDCYNWVAPGIWLGRRAYVGELPDCIDLIVDLTA
ncbi:MAG: hypothetical protein F6J93_21575 [Oscillatoria sp. SIO1A7]|nr:hypothetical protein [Oscillatoria sp. SIO1A7]